MTQAEWLASLEACGGDLSQSQVIQHIYDKGPNALWSETALKMHDYKPLSTYRYFASRFPKRVFADWSGVKEMGTIYHNAHIPFNLGVFQRSMQVCNGAALDECRRDYCEIPQGGLSTLPEMEMWKTGLKTQRICIANIRTSRQALNHAKAILDERFAADEQVMNMFYTMAAMRMLGHKWVLEYDPATNLPIPSTNPYNALRGYRYSYMDALFPQVGNINNIATFDMFFLDQFGRGLTNSRNPNYITMGKRGEPIFELWVGDDWYKQEVLDNGEWMDKLKTYMSNSILPGYTLEAGESEIIGNFKIRQMAALPRFAESTQGGFTIVQQSIPVEVENGTRALHNYREWDNAPFLTAIAMGRDVGEIITRPAITTGVEGRPIHPINGSGDWEYWNEYDKDCNPEKNMPQFKKWYEMGFRMKNPDSGWGFIYRGKKFRIREIDTCNLREIIQVEPETSSCAIVSIGCRPTETHPNHFMREGNTRKVLCNAVTCGSNLIHRVTVRRESYDAIQPNENPLNGCECGDTIKLIINDEDGNYDETITGTITDYMQANMVKTDPQFWITIAAPLSAGQCIAAILCDDETPEEGNVISCVAGDEEDTVKVALDSKLDCEVGDEVTVTYYDAEGAELGQIVAEITAANHLTFVYTLEGVSGFGGAYEPANFACDSWDYVTMKVECNP